ncbi:hypothetical protein V7S43_010773 [Phytophthora oleae]|uniref:Uncharacterized protein n=1 Tax=Phytophthora oleae TaxID=2107226 RepID=A0ABD3FCK5_9STRA
MADIEDATEFDEMLQSVLKQWRNNTAAARLEFGISDDEEFEADDAPAEASQICATRDADHDNDSSPVKIRLNPKAKKVGRPAKQKKKTVAGEKSDRKWYAAAEDGRKAAGEVTLDGLFAALDRSEPGIIQTQRRLAGIIVKFSESDNKKNKYKRMKNPVLIMDPFYILPG